MKIESDQWLAEIFGHPVFKVSLSDHSQAGLPEEGLKGKLEKQAERPGFYYAKIPTARLEQVQALTALGFQVVDVNVTFERRPAKEPIAPVSQNVMVRDVLPADHEALLTMAYSCFDFSRFHLDPLISKETANLIKRNWVFNYILGKRGERLLVAEMEGKPVGFLCELSAAAHGERINIIDLIGVDRAYQGRGAGRALVNFFTHSSARSYQRLRVGTQVANIPSLRLYEACGFRVSQTTYVLHAHIPGREAPR